MFGRRRRAQVPIERPAAPERDPLTPDEVYELVNRRVADALGPEGRYSLVLRSAADTDAIFSQLASRSLSLAITQSIVGAGGLAQSTPASSAHTSRRATPAERAEAARREQAAVAVWADPVRHDPDSVDRRIVAPSTETVPLRAVVGS